MKRVLIIMSMFLLSISACNSDYGIVNDGIYAVFITNMGDFTCELFSDKSPITVANFVGLAEGTREFVDASTNEKLKRPFYNGLTFHRVIKDFVIQGGCPLGNGTGNPGYNFLDEVNNGLKFDSSGYLAMANSGPNTNGSQFFITLNPTPHLNDRHTIFGKVISGMDIVTKISEINVDKSNMPFKDIVIKKIKIVKKGEEFEKFDAEKVFATKDKEFEKLEEVKKMQEKEFLKQLGIIEDQIIETKIGLKYVIKKKGTGKTPKKGDTIVAHYSGYLVDGTKFDSSYERNEPFETEIGVGRVIAGWDEAFLQMQEGEKRVLILPYYLAYGERGYPPVIPAKATLIFDVELLKVK